MLGSGALSLSERRRRLGGWIRQLLGGFLIRFKRRGFHFGRFPRYRTWLTQHLAASGRLPSDLPVSVLIPVFEPSVSEFRELLLSLTQQSHTAWEAVICDDGSSDPARIQAEVARLDDPRVRLIRLDRNSGIARATAAALAEARHEIVCFVDHDDVLTSVALREVAGYFERHPETALVYTDEDKISGGGRFDEPYFKPDFDQRLLYSRNYINHLTAVRASVARAVGMGERGLDGAQDYDFVLRVMEHVGPESIGHIPVVAYHWRHKPMSSSFSHRFKEESEAAGRRALEAHFKRTGQTAHIHQQDGNRHLVWPVPRDQSVSVIIPTRDKINLLDQCVAGVLESGSDLCLEIVVVDNDSRSTEARDWLEQVPARDSRVKVIRGPGDFNFSALVNAGAASARSDLFLLLNNDVSGGSKGWLELLAGEALRSGAGPVGPKLLYPDGRIQHAGVVLGPDGAAGHFMKGERAHRAGPFHHLQLTRTVSAVTGACMMVRRSVFEECGGFDEAFPVAFNDVDFCLRCGAAGFASIWRHDVVLTHLEGASRGREDGSNPAYRVAREDFQKRWAKLIERDRYQNPNLDPTAELASLNWGMASQGG
ncbi:glycosyltransferase family 2 protein [Maricaulis sp. CAU 1757]